MPLSSPGYIGPAGPKGDTGPKGDPGPATAPADVTGNAGTATKLQTARTISATGDMAWSTTFDGSGNATAASTLPSVNGNVGAFGSSTAIPIVTVNAKGLVTAVSTAAIVNPAVSMVNITIDGGGVAITTGVKTDITIPFAATITGWSLLADQSGSVQVDLWKTTLANAPGAVANSITASAKPVLSGAVKASSTTLAGWTTTVAAGDVIRINVDSAATVQRVTLALQLLRV